MKLKNDANRATDVAPCKYPIRYTELLVDVVRISYALVHMHIQWKSKKNHKKENHVLQSFLSVAISQVSDIWRSAGPIYYLLMLQWIGKNCNVRLSDRNILFGLEFSFRMCSLNHKSQTYILWVGILYEHLWKYPQHFRNINVVVFKNKGNGENACVSIRSLPQTNNCIF